MVRSNFFPTEHNQYYLSKQSHYFVGGVTVLTDLEARVALKELIEKYLREIAIDFDRLIGIIHDPSRQVPIR